MKQLLILSLVLLVGCQAQLSLRSHSTPETQKPSPVHGSMTALPAVMSYPPTEDDKSSPACMCNPDALKQAVLDRIFDSGIGSVIYENEQYPDKLTKAGLDTAQHQLDRLSRYRDALKDHCLQDAYSSWVSFYQSVHDEGIQKLEHPEEVQRDSSRDEQKEKDREVAECKRRGTVPRMVIP